MTAPVTKVVRFPDPVYLRSIVVVVGPLAAWRKEAARLGVPESELPAGGDAWTLALQKDTGEMILMLLPPYDRSVNWYDSLVHEVAHAVDRVFDSVRVPTGILSTEARAYLTGFYFSSVLRSLQGKRVRVAKDGVLTT